MTNYSDVDFIFSHAICHGMIVGAPWCDLAYDSERGVALDGRSWQEKRQEVDKAYTGAAVQDVDRTQTCSPTNIKSSKQIIIRTGNSLSDIVL